MPTFLVERPTEDPAAKRTYTETIEAQAWYLDTAAGALVFECDNGDLTVARLPRLIAFSDWLSVREVTP